MRSSKSLRQIAQMASLLTAEGCLDRLERACYIFTLTSDEAVGPRMAKMFAEKSIEIHASARRVWDVLTSQESTGEWASEFTAGGPALHIESDWLAGSPVLWKDRKGHVVVEGSVTAAEPYVLLRFTVYDVRGERPPASPEDGITYKLTEREGTTVLWVSQGDFSTMVDGATYRDLSEDIWDRVLARIKRLSEGSGVTR